MTKQSLTIFILTINWTLLASTLFLNGQFHKKHLVFHLAMRHSFRDNARIHNGLQTGFILFLSAVKELRFFWKLANAILISHNLLRQGTGKPFWNAQRSVRVKPYALRHFQIPFTSPLQKTYNLLIWGGENGWESVRRTLRHRSRINTEKRQRSSLLFGGQYLLNSLPR